MNVVDADPNLVDPFLIGMLRGKRGLELLVSDDSSLLHVDEQYLPGLEPPAAADAGFLDLHGARFGRHDDEIVLGREVARGPQAVAVENGAHLAAVREGDGCRTIPGLHERGIVFIERAQLRVHGGILFPGLGNQHHRRLRERVAAHDEKFKGIVEGCRIGLPLENERPDLVEVASKHGGRNMLFARLDPVEVAAQRIDFAVVGDHAEGVRELPLREGIGREALVDHRERGGAAGILKVAVVDAHLSGEELPLIDHGSRRTRADVELAAVPQLQIGNGD